MTALADIQYVTLVEGDDVVYVGSIPQHVGTRFCVTGRDAIAAVHLAAIAEGTPANTIPEAYRYEITNVGLPATLRNVRRDSLRPIR